MKFHLRRLLRCRERNTLFRVCGGMSVKDEGGYMLLELLTVMPIISVVMGVMAMTTIMIMDVSAQNNNHIMTLTQVQNAGYWVTRDAMNGQVITPAPSTGVLVNIAWDDWAGTHNEIDYILSEGQLKRQENGGDAIIIAQHIVENDTSLIQDPNNVNKYIFTVTASIGETQLERDYEVSMRVPADS